MRILSLMSLAETSKELPFDLLQKQLQINADEIESFVIDGNNLDLQLFWNSRRRISVFLEFNIGEKLFVS